MGHVVDSELQVAKEENRKPSTRFLSMLSCFLIPIADNNLFEVPYEVACYTENFHKQLWIDN